MKAYPKLTRDKQWQPEFKQIADFGAADVAQLTSIGLAQPSERSRRIETKRKTAVVVQGDVPFGLGRMDEAFTGLSPEEFGFFGARRRR